MENLHDKVAAIQVVDLEDPDASDLDWLGNIFRELYAGSYPFITDVE